VEDLIDAGRYADARSVIGLAKPQDREDAALLLLEGRAHLLERDLIRAQAALLAAVKTEPNMQAAYRYLGEVLLKRGDPLRARKTLRRALALAGDDEEARELLERAEYLVEAANDSLEALPVARDSEFDVDAQAELQAAEFVDQLPSEPAGAALPADAPQATAGQRKREDEPTSQFRFGRHRASEAPPEPPGSHRQKTQADHVPAAAAPPRQRPRREEGLETSEGQNDARVREDVAAPLADLDAGMQPHAAQEPLEGAASKERLRPGAARQRAGSAGAFQPPLPAARERAPADETAFDSEPAAPHPQARPGTEPKRPSARRDPRAVEPPPPARDRPPEPSRAASPRGAWTAQGTEAGDSEPAMPHPAARAGAEPARRVPEPLAANPISQRKAPAVDPDDDYPAWQEDPQAGSPRRAATSGADDRAAKDVSSSGREEAAARRAAPTPPRRAATSGADDDGRADNASSAALGSPRRAAAAGSDADRGAIDGLTGSRDAAAALGSPRRAAAAGKDDDERAENASSAALGSPRRAAGAVSLDDKRAGGKPAADDSAEDDYPAWNEAAPGAGGVASDARGAEPGSGDAVAGRGRLSEPGDVGRERALPPAPPPRRAAASGEGGRSSAPAGARTGAGRALPPAPPRRAATDTADSGRDEAGMRRSSESGLASDAAGDSPGRAQPAGALGASSDTSARARRSSAPPVADGAWSDASARRSSAPAEELESARPDASARAGSSLEPAGEASWGGAELERPAGPTARRSAERVQPSIRPGKRLSDFRIHPGSGPAEQPEAVAFAADGGDQPDPEQVLELVRQMGLFEDPTSQPEAWVERREVEPRGQRVRGALFWLWGVSLLLCVGGYFGWLEFVARRHAAADSLIAEARLLMSQGDHAALVDAERLLRLAREQHPASVTVTEEALFVQLQRVLEDGERDTASLRTAYARAHASGVTGPGMALANLLLSAAVADIAGRDRALNEVFAMAKGDARTLYLVGRAEERMGSDAAQSHLEAAVSADAKLIPAQLALAERAYERGERAAATRMLETAVGVAPNQLRVRLFRMLVVADDAEPDKLRQDLNGLATPLRKGNSIDRALAALVRARLARRGGEHAGALKAIDAAAQSGVEDARVLSWLAEEALAIGNSLLAQQLASHALQLAPERVRSRRLLARIFVERGAGQQAFVLLASLPPTDVEVQVLKARAALLSNDPELLRNALAALPSAWPKKSDVDVQRAALRLRIETQLDPSKAVLDRAQRLAHSAPTDADALLALAEAALAMRDAKLAQNALKQRALLMPDDVQAQTLLGRSLRMGGDVVGAETAFRHALSLRPGYVEAQTGLASLLLDRGQYSEADVVYRELALRDETALSGRLGRVEALLGQGKLADAQVQLEAAPEPERATAAYREVFAKLALARGEVGQAIKLLAGLSEELPKRASLRALHAEALLTAAQISPADSEIDAALALDPGLPEALLGRAELQLRANKTKDALATLDKAEGALRDRLRPPAVSARRLILLGRTLTQRKKRGDAENAARTLRQVTGQPAAPAEAYFYLGEALTLAKDKAGAQEAYRRYIEVAPSGVYRQRAQRMLGAAR